MKTVILAGGMGTRLAEETGIKPKPMVEIGGKPILWHIMKLYSHFGHSEFYIALGYRGEIIKSYFLDYYALSGNVTIDMRRGGAVWHENDCEDWTVHCFDTGIETLTGSRIKRLQTHLAGGTFLATYGDGVSNVDIASLLSFHRKVGKIATVTAVRPPARFGGLVVEDDLVTDFTEKPDTGEGWINGGFMVFEPEVFDLLRWNGSSLETDGLEALSRENQLAAYKHEGFWQCMDNLRELKMLEELCRRDETPWMVWKNPNTSQKAA